MFIELNTVCYKNYVVKVKNNIKINPKKFYDFVTASSDDKQISNLFAIFFKTTYSTEIFNEFENYPYSLQSFESGNNK